MDVLKTPRLRLAQLQSFSQSALNIVQGFPEVETETNAATTAFNAFKESMINIQISSNKKGLDDARDRLISGVVQASKAELKFPHDDSDVATAVKQFTDIVNSYGNDVAEKPYDEESAEVDNLLDELKRVDLTVLEPTGLPRWIPVIENANNAFKTRSDEVIEETAAAEYVEAATKLSSPLITALNQLFVMLFSQANSTKSEALFTAHKEIEVLVDSYR